MSNQAERYVRKGLTEALRVAMLDDKFIATLAEHGKLSGMRNVLSVTKADDGNLVVRMAFTTGTVYLNVKVTVMLG